MSDDAVIVLAMLTFKNGLPREVRDFLPELVAKTRAEAGCIRYVPHLPSENDSKLYFHEEWENATALEKHAASEHLKKFRELAAPHLVDGKSDVTLWRAIA
ncbi:putative quinol monooxygenase [Oceanidesulfovibrio indonesiensis]|nr:putative quinol monooxygenase [Oceanidesulfovibrio indonesiensis]